MRQLLEPVAPTTRSVNGWRCADLRLANFNKLNAAFQNWTPSRSMRKCNAPPSIMGRVRIVLFQT